LQRGALRPIAAENQVDRPTRLAEGSDRIEQGMETLATHMSADSEHEERVLGDAVLGAKGLNVEIGRRDFLGLDAARDDVRLPRLRLAPNDLLREATVADDRSAARDDSPIDRAQHRWHELGAVSVRHERLACAPRGEQCREPCKGPMRVVEIGVSAAPNGGARKSRDQARKLRSDPRAAAYVRWNPAPITEPVRSLRPPVVEAVHIDPVPRVMINSLGVMWSQHTHTCARTHQSS
jgi:hypothetical protein